MNYLKESKIITNSELCYKKALNLMPGGVSSPVRSIKPFPFYVNRAHGSRIYDIDENSYLDYCLGYGPLILGHSNKNIEVNLIDQIKKGWLYGTPCIFEIELAELIIKYYDSINMVRFVSTGTEATMSAVRLSRGFTKKSKIIKINGGFHGSHDSVLTKKSNSYIPNSNCICSGIPLEVSNNTLHIEYNNIESLVDIIENKNFKDNISCLIIEPVLGNIGCIKPNDNYLLEVRKITSENDILLIFDEVITGCRLSLGGAQSFYNIKPDITTLGKIIGGGLPIGAFGASKEIMEHISPKGEIYQAGTYSGNPLSLCSGISTLKYMEKYNVCSELNNRCLQFFESINDILIDKKLDEKYHFEFISSMFTLFFGKKPYNYSDVLKCDIKKYTSFWNLMLKDGIFMPPSQFETNFVSYVHSKEDLNKTADIFLKNITKVEKQI